jgi:hypothetical protein
MPSVEEFHKQKARQIARDVSKLPLGKTAEFSGLNDYNFLRGLWTLALTRLMEMGELGSDKALGNEYTQEIFAAELDFTNRTLSVKRVKEKPVSEEGVQNQPAA